jgi:hypothetical protein
VSFLFCVCCLCHQELRLLSRELLSEKRNKNQQSRGDKDGSAAADGEDAGAGAGSEDAEHGNDAEAAQVRLQRPKLANSNSALIHCIRVGRCCVWCLRRRMAARMAAAAAGLSRPSRPASGAGLHERIAECDGTSICKH